MAVDFLKVLSSKLDRSYLSSSNSNTLFPLKFASLLCNMFAILTFLENENDGMGIMCLQVIVFVLLI